jgi:hypothetical protein
MAKLEPLFLPRHERCLILESDVVVMGPVLERLEQYDEDFVVAYESHPSGEIHRYYFNEEAVHGLDPAFQFPGYVFNSGQIVTNTGIFQRAEFAQFVSFSEPRQPLLPELFLCGEQGFLNYLVLSKVQRGEITLKRHDFMKWSGRMRPDEVETIRLQTDSPYDFMVHWAGPKTKAFSTTAMGYLLEFFEDEYYHVVGLHGLRRHLHEMRNSAGNLWTRVMGKSVLSRCI